MTLEKGWTSAKELNERSVGVGLEKGKKTLPA